MKTFFKISIILIIIIIFILLSSLMSAKKTENETIYTLSFMGLGKDKYSSLTTSNKPSGIMTITTDHEKTIIETDNNTYTIPKLDIKNKMKVIFTLFLMGFFIFAVVKIFIQNMEILKYTDSILEKKTLITKNILLFICFWFCIFMFFAVCKLW